MADLFGNGSADLDVTKVLVALKKGTQLLKYGRKGKPKVYTFRLSHDESSLIWFSSSGERSLKLASVSRIISGQRTSVFRRDLRPEKEYLSFSLIYNNGKRSLDLVCKDKVEAEVWFAGLNALISSGQYGRSKIDGGSEGGLYLDLQDSKDLVSNSPRDSSISTLLDSPGHSLSTSTLPKDCSFENLVHSESSDVTKMQIRGSSSDVFRVSVSSAPSTSSYGSAQDDCDAFGDVYVWGEVVFDTFPRPSADRNVSTFSSRTDILLPKPLESNVVLDIHHVACGVRHAALVTRQGEVFTWGEESGGRLGHGAHGAGTDIIHPRLIESLSASNVDFVACGEFHTCAVTAAGELYTWGDGTHNAGILGHGTDISHWIPKRVSGPLEGLQVASVACGTWHTALITSTGQLFTFGDGTFGALGHGNRENILYPREVESLIGLKTIAVSCGVWHTSAAVEVIMTQSSASSGKLFTWGDGDKYRLGHGDKEPRLKPACVPSLIDYNFQKLACGQSLTIGLTTSGQVFTMGSSVYGQLGNPRSDGKLPCLVEDKLCGESVAEVACGSYHVAVLTTRSEIYTWGKGANGRLGHGDLEDRKIPTLVGALKDRPVQRIACGSNFTAAICYHKWVSGAEQYQCSACRQAFGFTRKRHNCYNCGLVHCHSCSMRKALRAALSPNPRKPYRVCDSCYVKLNKAEFGGPNTKKNFMPRLSSESKDKSKIALPRNLDLIKNLDIKATRHEKKSESSLIRTPQFPPLLQLKDIAFGGGSDLHHSSLVQSVNHSRAVSPFSGNSSTPRSATPMPTISGLSFSKDAADNSLKKTNALLFQQVQKLHTQVASLRQRYELQEFELQKSAKKAQEAMTIAAEETSKSKAAKEVIKSLTAQLRDMADKLPHGAYENNIVRPIHLLNGIESYTIRHTNLNGEHLLRNDASNDPQMRSTAIQYVLTNGMSGKDHVQRDNHETNGMSMQIQDRTSATAIGMDEHLNMERFKRGEMPTSSGRLEDFDQMEPEPLQNGEHGSKPRIQSSASYQVDAEWIEQYEPGVYITLVALQDGSRDLKRVRFSRRRFGEHQAETWWSENRLRVYARYDVRSGSDRASSVTSSKSAHRSEEEFLSNHQNRKEVPLEAT